MVKKKWQKCSFWTFSRNFNILTVQNSPIELNRTQLRKLMKKQQFSQLYRPAILSNTLLSLSLLPLRRRFFFQCDCELWKSNEDWFLTKSKDENYKFVEMVLNICLFVTLALSSYRVECWHTYLKIIVTMYVIGKMSWQIHLVWVYKKHCKTLYSPVS